MGFPGGSEVKASAFNVGDPGSIPGSGRSPGDIKGFIVHTKEFTVDPEVSGNELKSDKQRINIFTFVL